MSLVCWLVNTFMFYGFIVSCVVAGCVSLFLYWYWKVRSYSGDLDKYWVFKDKKLKNEYEGKKIPLSYLHEAYFDMGVDLKEGLDLLQVLEDRESYSTFTITPEHIKFFFTNVVPEFFVHSKAQDRAQIADHYNRGNDFFNWFLGDTMVYTSGLFKNKEQSLEEAQYHKIKTVCERLHLKKGETLLDIGCGWGTFIRYAVKNFGVKALGVSISKEQQKWHEEQCKKEDVDPELAKFQCSDYRDISRDQKFDKISCLEMSEHVGILNYKSFLKQVYNLLKDDGLFYLQIAGLRMTSHLEDYVWAFFMDKYIFPGADASLPLTFPIFELETAGFEVHSVETIGIHYSLTINRWYDNWKKNKDEVIKKYGERWYRLWEWFLAWSTIIARQGNSTCYMITAHKNRNNFDRYQWVTETRI